ncbi:MAG: ABC transporter substrate-binding protein [bacterium]|nr:ABC transporter substrate-binding protein [bacterium]
MKITVAHSPDSDDYFLFWAIVTGRISTAPYRFSFSAHDTQTLNTMAAMVSSDIVAISVAAYSDCAKNYAILDSGASIGRGYGPVVVAKPGFCRKDLDNARIAIPGSTTTAALVLSQALPSAQLVTIPIEPFENVFQSLKTGEVDAALLIHEGQVAFPSWGFIEVENLASLWQVSTSLPLPLGINVIRKALGNEHIKDISSILAQSVAFAIRHKAQALSYLTEINHQRGTSFTDPEKISHYLDLYANNDSLRLAPECREGIIRLLAAKNMPMTAITWA